MIKSEIYIRSIKSLISHIKMCENIVVLGGKTSTVIPYQIPKPFSSRTKMMNLSQMPKELSLDSYGNLLIRGPVDWREARVYCESNGREILTAPTEDTAHILSGLATSATGERCFGFGTLRDQVTSLKYLNFEGELKSLVANEKFKVPERFKSALFNYQKHYEAYKKFKNAPFPRFQKQTDLMIGTEGQLGVITEAVIETKKKAPTSFFFMLLPKWEDDYSAHLEIFKKVQSHRGQIYSCELIDSNSLSVLPKEENPGNGSQDLIFIEFETTKSDYIFENFVSSLTQLSLENIFEIGAAKCHELRMKVPRLTFEKNSLMGVVKKGTDVQVHPAEFKKLLDIYRKMGQVGVDYNLFGHFGDAHLHFNFLPAKDQTHLCDKALEKLYNQTKDLNGSPFAEHGIGLIKKKFIQQFYGNSQHCLFKALKSIHDPENKFFPEGFMSISDELSQTEVFS